MSTPKFLGMLVLAWSVVVTGIFVLGRPRALQPGELDSLLPGTYQITVHRRSILPARAAATGTLVLLDSTVPARAHYWLMGSPNACLTLRGDLRVFALQRATPDSFATLTQWSRDSTGLLKLPVFSGVDYGYSVEFSLRRGKLTGSGHYSGVASWTGTHWTRWTAKYLGPPIALGCAPALHQDSVRAEPLLRPN